MTGHEFPEGENVRCVHCGTLKEHHNRLAQSCPRKPRSPSDLCPEPYLRINQADDADAIHARILELQAEREAQWNTIKAETE